MSRGSIAIRRLPDGGWCVAVFASAPMIGADDERDKHTMWRTHA
jgi:hypothetical protein